jgi:hypothetical protein
VNAERMLCPMMMTRALVEILRSIILAAAVINRMKQSGCDGVVFFVKDVLLVHQAAIQNLSNSDLSRRAWPAWHYGESGMV